MFPGWGPGILSAGKAIQNNQDLFEQIPQIILIGEIDDFRRNSENLFPGCES